MASYDTCFDVSPECPVIATTYGYYPSLWANTTLCVLFGICTLAQIGLGIYYRTWTWMATVSFGCALEFAGFVGRIFMHSNPWNNSAFQVQIITLIIGPSFLIAGINLTLKHLVLAFHPPLSRLKPALYTWLFITIDFSCIAIQAIGGGMAASASNTMDLTVLRAGNNVILTGICLQVVNLLVFGAVGVEYALRLRKRRSDPEIASKVQYAKDAKLRWFLGAVVLAYLTLLIRSTYRIPEMAFGWGSPNQRNEPEFLALESLMVVIGAVAITVVHPGWSFPGLAKTVKLSRGTRRGEKAEEEASP